MKNIERETRIIHLKAIGKANCYHQQFLRIVGLCKLSPSVRDFVLAVIKERTIPIMGKMLRDYLLMIALISSGALEEEVLFECSC